MSTGIRLIAITAALFLGFVLVVATGLPRLTAWQLEHCMGGASTGCQLSASVLSYWWLAVLPLFLALTVLINWAIAGRRAI
jgi:hypothetical protein